MESDQSGKLSPKEARELEAALRDGRARSKQRSLDRKRGRRREEAPIRILTAAPRWIGSPGVSPWSSFAIRLRSVVALLHRVDAWPIDISAHEGKMIPHAEWMLQEASEHRTGWRSRIAERLESIYDLSCAAGVVGFDPCDDREWGRDPVASRDSVLYFRDGATGSSDSLFGDIERAMGMSAKGLRGLGSLKDEVEGADGPPSPTAHTRHRLEADLGPRSELGEEPEPQHSNPSHSLHTQDTVLSINGSCERDDLVNDIAAATASRVNRQGPRELIWLADDSTGELVVGDTQLGEVIRLKAGTATWAMFRALHLLSFSGGRYVNWSPQVAACTDRFLLDCAMKRDDRGTSGRPKKTGPDPKEHEDFFVAGEPRGGHSGGGARIDTVRRAPNLYSHRDPDKATEALKALLRKATATQAGKAWRDHWIHYRGKTVRFGQPGAE